MIFQERRMKKKKHLQETKPTSVGATVGVFVGLEEVVGLLDSLGANEGLLVPSQYPINSQAAIHAPGVAGFVPGSYPCSTQ